MGPIVIVNHRAGSRVHVKFRLVGTSIGSGRKQRVLGAALGSLLRQGLTYAVECGFGGITGRVPANFMLPDPKSD